ncbi:phosphoribosylamine--glycine ligase [Keratinibaculum paraultunense]|uniref:Phosphoribosylamine--glycine ligase n=1 Tax=Keratinibaculum paraultunense TaxID=1278232 RepID=A0A4R3L491_9FIRM|nr:phosphoribosylamine--glycine ligase [Keratinibaculum paraultunense]QQY80160.1 phosphoribosylamine--glycine ligase [Keratinibaculum paraultunense]TCS91519.1 phosphoribosylamine--glycine ligase [Keratinibaculum paraultunense]
MKVLVIGGGGREHALCWKISQSKRVSKIFCAPGNGGTDEIAENVDIGANEIDKLVDFALKESIDLTVVGPEEPLVKGIVDKFKAKGLRIFGPNGKAAQLEGSKVFSKQFMEKYGIHTAKYKVYDNVDKAIEGLDEFDYPVVIKADGLCFGKGVIICNTKNEGIEALKHIMVDKAFGSQGNTIVLEEYLKGIEASLLCFVSGGKLFPMESAKDYKRIFDGDKGPNTGGVGCFSPNPLMKDKDLQRVIRREILLHIERGLEQEQIDYTGILYIGLMLTNAGPKILEFNCRFGDPETEVLLPRLETDIINIFQKTIDGNLREEDLVWTKKPCITVVATSKGYPGKYETGKEIKGLEDIDEDIILFHNGTKRVGDKLYTDGGRVISVTALGDTLEEAKNKVYDNIRKINFEGIYYREDIGEI